MERERERDGEFWFKDGPSEKERQKSGPKKSSLKFKLIADLHCTNRGCTTTAQFRTCQMHSASLQTCQTPTMGYSSLAKRIARSFIKTTRAGRQLQTRVRSESFLQRPRKVSRPLKRMVPVETLRSALLRV